MARLGECLGAGGPVLAVCAHPDDESFGLGAALSELAETRTVGLVCLTHGEASTIGGEGRNLHEVRAGELSRAAAVLGVSRVALFDHPDGKLETVPVALLADEVGRVAREVDPDLLLVFDDTGVTGHPDHRRATEAALAIDGRLPVLAWVLPAAVARRLNRELKTTFVGRHAHEVDLEVEVDRRRQLEAIACHASQAQGNAVLWRRLELQGEHEAFRWLRPP
ncbi:MAG TPA: PIG-L deacetylase family protein [Acidimicrobiales bacterium]|nr:PIG-L deacetylase family protein [Acidimicrobiales bacterium]